MKSLQKNQGRTDQMLGAMADVLTSVAMPNQQWVSYCSVVDHVVCLWSCLCESINTTNSQRKPHIWRCFSVLGDHGMHLISGSLPFI